jgi:hypothetical protein
MTLASSQPPADPPDGQEEPVARRHQEAVHDRLDSRPEGSQRAAVEVVEGHVALPRRGKVDQPIRYLAGQP